MAKFEYTKEDSVAIRFEVTENDLQAVRCIVQDTGFFRPDEVDVAIELVDERLQKGDASGYFFVIAEIQSQVVGYACYGPIACTLGSFDLYWIAVAPSFQGRGLGQRLIQETERLIRAAGGRNVYIETSGRPQYSPTRTFYQRCGYEVVAVLPEFYDIDDDKVVWARSLNS
ncbi:MAG: GNAT family N-acetyltransferase [Planctomycetaceae bacterium]